MGFDRVALIRNMVDGAGKGLEIGPSHNPLFPKKEGFDVETLDYTNADALRALYSGHPVNIDAIEHVDHVSDGRPIHEVVGKANCFDYVFSSHAIEHVTDFIGYFQSCEALIKPGGCAVLAIPDKRFVFDALRFPSTTGDVLEAWGRRDKRHSPGRVFDFFASYSTFENLHTWDINAEGTLELQNDLSTSLHWFDTARQGNSYIDVHAWTFSPASFRLIIRDLNDLGLLDLKIAKLVQNDTFEFYVCLTKEAAPNAHPRSDLALDVHREQLIGSRQITGINEQNLTNVDGDYDSEIKYNTSFVGKVGRVFKKYLIPK